MSTIAEPYPAASARIKTRMGWWEWLVLLALLAAFALLALGASPHKSASFDEQYHLTAGYTYWKTGDYRLATTHPPLAGMIGALPLLWDDTIVLPLDDPTWQAGNRADFSDRFLWYANQHGPAMVVAGRQAIVVLGLLLVLAVFLWARALFGFAGALLAGTLVAFDPNLIANSRQITTDIAVTLFLLLTLWQLWRWLQRPRWATLLLVGVLTGLTLVSKYNGLLVLPLVTIGLLIYPFPADAPRGQVLRDRLVALVAIGLLALGVVWAIYRFSFGWVPILGSSLPLPAPFYWTHVMSTLTGILNEGSVKPDFLLGMVGQGGWWYYFPVAIAVKTPLPLLLFLVVGIAALIWRGGWREQAFLHLVPIFILAMALTSILTIGYRHLLPALPFMALLAANSARWPRGQTMRMQRSLYAAGSVLLLWLVISTVRFFPNHDSYFNELAGRWQNWSNLLVDSNLDWGQDLPALARTMQEMGIERVNLAYFGKAVPELYGVAYAPLPGYLRFMGGREPAAYNPLDPEPGWYAISATSLRLGNLRMEDVDLYAWFHTLEPVARAGYSIYLYEVPASAPAARALVTEVPAWRNPDGLLEDKAGRVQVKWRQSPNSEILSGAAAELPVTADFRRVGADFAGVFTLEGYTHDPAEAQVGGVVGMELYWRRGAAAAPMPAPTRGEALSAFVHVTTEDGTQTIAQFDGWDVALRGLEAGDLVVQRAEIAFAEDVTSGAYALQAGLYSPQNGQRLAVATRDGMIDAVPIGQLTLQPRAQE